MKTNEKVFMELVEECKGMMEECGFELPKDIKYMLNKRLTRTLGRCSRNSKGKFTIEYSNNYLEEYLKANDIKSIKHTILHEMCHALPHGFNHGEVWKRYANKINSKFYFNIKRLHDVDKVVEVLVEKRKTRNENPRVKLICNECGKEYTVSSKGVIIKNLGGYHCVCGCKQLNLV